MTRPDRESDRDAAWMEECLNLARAAAERGEVPVGAVVVRDGEVLGRGSNAPIATSDPTAHAEVQALRAAAKAVGNYRLPGAELFVTVEPCLMCAGAILQARIDRVVFGCSDVKFGFVGSLGNVSNDPRLNHRFAVRSGLMEEQAAALLVDFFRRRRTS